ncbi:hypothetical protein J2T13_004998 [Paenibacillus sp. DS2015]|uniref:hypothetical protein n=1 Tax=Paenibacillus sp. DS2015 TaxID=3373917 RepID=UPI003D2087A8
MKQNYPIVMLCTIAEVSRAGFCKWKSTIEARKARREKDSQLKEHFLAIHRLRPYFGVFCNRKVPRIATMNFCQYAATSRVYA